MRVHGRYVHNIVVWGSTTETQVPDVSHASVDDQSGSFGDGSRAPGAEADQTKRCRD